MKLVDILAQELKVWPEGNDFAWQDYDLEIRFSYTSRIGIYVSILADDHVRSLYGDNPSYGVTRAEWQAAVDALNAPKVVEWAKGSLPPIGSVVEWDGCTFAPEEPQEKDLRIGDQVTIIAHLKDGDFEMAAFTFNPKIHNQARGSIWVNQGAYGCFRPIRTAEQVAAEEREKAAEALYMAVTDHKAKVWPALQEHRKDHYRGLVDAGWQKVTK